MSESRASGATGPFPDCDSVISVGGGEDVPCERLAGHDGEHIASVCARLVSSGAAMTTVTADVEWL